GHMGEAHAYATDRVSGALYRLRLDAGAAWETLDSEEKVQGTVLVAHRGSLYRVGGMTARNPPGQPADLYSLASVARFDVEQRRWESFPPLPEPRSSHDACWVGDKLYVAGGWALK